MSIQRAENELIWLAVANVRPQMGSSVLDGASGAHVAVFGFCEDEDAFMVGIRRLMSALEFDLLEVKEVELTSFDEFKLGAGPEISEIARTLTEETPVGYGTFYTYPAQNS